MDQNIPRKGAGHLKMLAPQPSKQANFCDACVCLSVLIVPIAITLWYLYSPRYDALIDIAALKKDYQDNVFGQHLVELVVLKAVPDFLNNTNPKKPLVLSFHGWTGGGKNHVSQILVRNIYPGVDKRKKCVQSFDVSYHFSQEENIVKEKLKQRIYGTVKQCERAIFIFDEMDKMPPGLIDVIKPYLDYYEELDGLSFRKCIFIFLSNTGGEKLTELAMEFWRNHKVREDIKLLDVESHLSRHAFNKKSGFWHSSLIDRNLIDVFVPFFPLEMKHVKMCVRAELRQRGRTIDEELVSKIAEEMSYHPEKERIFSVKGCKTVATKISLYL
ncbi:torsin-1A-like isoform X1 [Ranitomeya variabilis]|uniref:torsin-1A-like isoform X1 n=1 Tax=Ranitomeya variabilis TaxID=490064 RepID=UPI00405673D9